MDAWVKNKTKKKWRAQFSPALTCLYMLCTIKNEKQNLVFTSNTGANSNFFKRSFAGKSLSLPLWKWQIESLNASAEVKHQQKNTDKSQEDFHLKLYNFSFYCWGQSFLKSESYIKPLPKISTQGQQMEMEKTKAAYILQDSNSCSTHKWCSTRRETY